MTIASTVVELIEGASETALGRLAVIPQISIYGIRDNRIVAVIEDANPERIEDVVKKISLLDEVRSVYPVYLADDDCFEY